MGEWNKSPEDVLFGYEPELWELYPRHIARAFFAVSYEDVIIAQEEKLDIYNEAEVARTAIRAFEQRWGGLSDEIFAHVF